MVQCCLDPPITRARVGRDRDARVIKELGLVVMAQWTTTRVALIGTGTRGCLSPARCPCNGCRQNFLWCKVAQCCLDPPIARAKGRLRPRCMRNHRVRARDDRRVDHYVLRTSWNRYPRLFEADRLLIPWLQTVFSSAETVPNRTDCSA